MKLEFKQKTNQEENSDKRYEIISVMKKYIGEGIDEEFNLSSYNIDSISFVKMILELERTFQFEADDFLLTISNFSTLGSFVDCIINKIKTQED